MKDFFKPFETKAVQNSNAHKPQHLFFQKDPMKLHNNSLPLHQSQSLQNDVSLCRKI